MQLMPSSPDPVADPSGYQRHLLGLLGDDDPAEVQGSSPTAWRELVDESGDRLNLSPAEGEWSVLECLGHACDAEVVASGRYRWIIAHDEPQLIGYDQDLWVDRLRHREGNVEDMFGLLEPLRRANLELWARSSDEERARVGLHTERGPESYDLTFRLIAGHDRFHLAQARRALDAIG